MRPALLATALLSAVALPALAQQGSGWVDPPAKAAGPGRTEESSKPEPEKPAPVARSEAKPVPEADSEPRPAREARRPTRARAAEVRQARRESAREANARTHRPAAAPLVFEAPRPQESARQETARAVSDPRFSGWAGTAQRLSEDYLDSVSSPSAAMVASAPRFYGDQVRFYGRNLSLSGLMAEKRRFVRRWPDRRYEPQGDPQVGCNAGSASCQVRTTYAFSAASPERGARSQGVAELVLTVSFAGPRPVIVSETSRVLRRGALSASAGGRQGA